MQLTKNKNFVTDLNYYFHDLDNCKILPYEETLKLYEKYKNERCIESRNKLCESCMILAFRMAKKYVSPNCNIHDLISEANEAILEAVEAWNPIKGRLTTVVTTFVKNKLNSYAQHGNGTIRIPRTTYMQYKKIESLPNNLDSEELSKQIRKNKLRALQLLDNLKSYKIESVSSLTKDEFEIESRSDSQEGKHSLLEAYDFLDCLNKKDKEIICLFYGIKKKKKNLHEIAGRFKVSRYQIEMKIKEIINLLKDNDISWQESFCIKCEDKFFKPKKSARKYCYSCKAATHLHDKYLDKLVKN